MRGQVLAGVRLALIEALKRTEDAQRLLDSEDVMPPRPRPDGRHTVGGLGLAIMRAGYSRTEIAHLTGIELARVDCLIAGADVPGDDERARLERLVGVWR